MSPIELLWTAKKLEKSWKKIGKKLEKKMEKVENFFEKKVGR